MRTATFGSELRECKIMMRDHEMAALLKCGDCQIVPAPVRRNLENLCWCKRIESVCEPAATTACDWVAKHSLVCFPLRFKPQYVNNKCVRGLMV